MPFEATYVTPDPKDQAEYQRLKGSLGFSNKDFGTMALLANKAMYDFFAGRQISTSAQAKIRVTLAQFQEQEKLGQKPGPSNGAVSKASSEAQSNTGQTSHPFEVAPERLAEYGQASRKEHEAKIADLVGRVEALEAAEAEPEVTDEHLAGIQFANLDQIQQQLDALAKTVEVRCCARDNQFERIEELERHRHDLREQAELHGADLLLLFERCDRLEAKLAKLEAAQGKELPKSHADRAQLAIDLLTHLSDSAVNAVYEVVRSRKTLMANHAVLSKAVGQ